MITTELHTEKIIHGIHGNSVGSDPARSLHTFRGDTLGIVNRDPLACFKIHLVFIDTANPDLTIYIHTCRGHHGSAGIISLFEARTLPVIEGLSVAIKAHDHSLVHHAQEDIAIGIEIHIEIASRYLGFGHGDGIFHRLTRCGVQYSQILGSKIAVPDHAVLIDNSVMGQGLRARQVIFRHDHTSPLSRRPRQGSKFIVPTVPLT